MDSANRCGLCDWLWIARLVVDNATRRGQRDLLDGWMDGWMDSMSYAQVSYPYELFLNANLIIIDPTLPSLMCSSVWMMEPGADVDFYPLWMPGCLISLVGVRLGGRLLRNFKIC